MKAVHELEAERNQQCDVEQDVSERGALLNGFEIGGEMHGDIADADHEDEKEDSETRVAITFARAGLLRKCDVRHDVLGAIVR